MSPTAQTAPPAAPPAPRGPGTTQEHALEGIRRAIVGGELRPGQRIAQEDLAGRLGVSVGPVREALRMLEQEGQVTYLPRRGYFVTELRIDDLEEIYALRSVLEATVARRALPALNGEVLAAVEAAAADCEAAVGRGDVLAELEANRRFHLGILAPAGMSHAMRLIRQLWDSTEAYRALYYNVAAERERSLADHASILAAIRTSPRDPDAVIAALDSHRDRGLQVLRQILAPDRTAG